LRLVFLVVVVVLEGKDNVSLGLGLSGDRMPRPDSARGSPTRGVWVASGEVGWDQRTYCSPARLPDFYVVVVDTVTVDERAAFEGDDAALLEAERPNSTPIQTIARPEDSPTSTMRSASRLVQFTHIVFRPRAKAVG